MPALLLGLQLRASRINPYFPPSSSPVKWAGLHLINAYSARRQKNKKKEGICIISQLSASN